MIDFKASKIADKDPQKLIELYKRLIQAYQYMFQHPDIICTWIAND